MVFLIEEMRKLKLGDVVFYVQGQVLDPSLVVPEPLFFWLPQAPSGEALRVVSTHTVCSTLIGESEKQKQEKTKSCPFGEGDAMRMKTHSATEKGYHLIW